MVHAYPYLVLAVPALLLAVGVVPPGWADRYPRAMRRGVVGLASLALSLTVIAAGLLIGYGPLDWAWGTMTYPISLRWGVYYDSLSALLLLLVSFIGWVITRYSVRYLDGEPGQGRFMRWISVTLGAVFLLLVSGNLVMMMAAWVLTSLGLHHLLTHYQDRPAARHAARTKFVISRIGDGMLLAAIALTYSAFGSLEYSTIFAQASSPNRLAQPDDWRITLLGILFVTGAMTKSAQFPFHTWLPNTLETPTPVSALMHAGIINAGGFLVIRLSPLLGSSHLALDLLTLVGGFTALMGSIVTLTQSSVKRSLAYSTIAQMGFMMLQCGLGAFSAALLHIAAHSLYKTHAFLSSGSVLDMSARLSQPYAADARRTRSVGSLILACAGGVTIWFSVAWLLGVFPSSKPGSNLLGLIVALSLVNLLWQAMTFRSPAAIPLSVSIAALACLAYYGGYWLVDQILAGSVSHTRPTLSPFDTFVESLIALGFLATFVLHIGIANFPQSRFLQWLYVQASNGFYCDIPSSSLVNSLWRPSPTAP